MVEVGTEPHAASGRVIYLDVKRLADTLKMCMWPHLSALQIRHGPTSSRNPCLRYSES
jgi:hypothetical protein